MSKGFNGGATKSVSIWKWLLTFEYSSSAEDVLRAIFQVCFLGVIIMTVKALDGEVCGRQQFNFWVPQTWLVNPACFVRSLTRTVPDNFLETTTEPAGQVQDYRFPESGPNNDELLSPNFQSSPQPQGYPQGVAPSPQTIPGG